MQCFVVLSYRSCTYIMKFIYTQIFCCNHNVIFYLNYNCLLVAYRKIVCSISMQKKNTNQQLKGID